MLMACMQQLGRSWHMLQGVLPEVEYLFDNKTEFINGIRSLPHVNYN